MQIINIGELAGIAPAQPDVIAETQRDGVVWQLLDLSPNQAGDIECLFHVENRSSELLEGSCHLGANRLRWNDLNGVDWKYFSDINMVGMDYKKLDASKWKPLPSGLLTPVWVMATMP